MKASKNALDLIKKFEGLVLKAYKPLPSEKYYTIGWGHYGEDVKIGMKITQEEAEKLLRSDISPIEKTLNGLNINLSQGEFVSFIRRFIPDMAYIDIQIENDYTELAKLIVNLFENNLQILSEDTIKIME